MYAPNALSSARGAPATHLRDHRSDR